MTYYKVWRMWCASNPEIGALRKFMVYLGLVKSCTFDVLRNVYHV
jgi:hypothetical protein